MTGEPSPPVFSIAGRVVLVTGAGRGIGQAIASGLTRLGASVYGMDLAFGDRASGFEAILCDIGDEDASQGALREIISSAGRLDGLVNNAGISLPPEACYSRASFERTLAINTLAPLRLSWAAAEHMKRHGHGSIVNVTSLGAHRGFPENPAYQASKAALSQLTRAMAVDYGRFGIRVNSLCPGYVRTEMTRRSWEDAALRLERSRRTSLERWGEPEDLIGPCAFLLSDAARYVTGIDLPVDGGWLTRGL